MGREAIYVKNNKPQQSSYGLDTKSYKYLSALFSDAEKTHPYLSDLAKSLLHLDPSLLKAEIPPLKRMERTAVKAAQKYEGDYSYVTDICRMTFECANLATAFSVLEELSHSAKFTLKLVKNRLMLEHNADQAGGYRDMLCNLECRETGHICEVQITLKPLLQIKTSGGHVAYELARVLNLFDDNTCKHVGALSDRVLSGITSGVIQKLEIRG